MLSWLKNWYAHSARKDNYVTSDISLFWFHYQENSWPSVTFRHSNYSSQYKLHSCFILFIALISDFHLNNMHTISFVGHPKLFKIWIKHTEEKKKHRKRKMQRTSSLHEELPVSQSLKIITPVFTRKKLNKLKSNNSYNERNEVTGQTAPPQHWRDRQDRCRQYNLQEQKLPEELLSGEENLISNWYITGDSVWRSSRVKNSRVGGGTSLVVQQLRIYFPRQGMWVWSLGRALRSHMPRGI